ncbi:phosphatase PAP2 family protein [Lipingzhangella sp. LS1_29]|uniref:Phosphatase PAP2 family protein n=1 Tax=Lipingzhangella rawalii TaxID=2055835 RepID=A0ABU2H4C0_9ACTN|nr:phosphatase PAP2 family protein [Lipingzhangella rawalii]MDS1269700.1 phosphatase PAP2 family protein [Lipingzhangella rawalii]
MDTITAVQQLATPWLDRVMLAVTYLGDAETYILLLAVIYLAVHPELGRRVGVYLLLSSLVNTQLKGLVDTPRPFELDPEAARSEAAVATAGGASFPSGHAQMSATFWGYLALWVRRRWLWILAATLVALISASRVYLGVHVPVDIAGGLLLAAVVLALALLVDRYLVPVLARWPLWLLLSLGLTAPLAVHLLLTTHTSGMYMGGLAALLTAPLVIHHQVCPTLARRLAVAILGIALVVLAWLGLGLLPDAVRQHPAGEFLEFLLLGYVGLALAPYLARLLSLAPRPEPG